MKNKLAFVLSGGGSRGALQVGALRAIFERGLRPDFLIGTSIGSVNGAFLALNGFSEASLDRLVVSWQNASAGDLLPKNYVRLALRAMLRDTANNPAHRLREFLIEHGMTPELRFGDLSGPRLYVVSADLNRGKPVLHGLEAEEKVLEALLLSTALPPWFMPVKKQDAYLVDGGMVSNLPIELAIQMGATHIVALDLMDARELSEDHNGFTGFLDRLTFAVERRFTDLEMELAQARGVPLLYMGLSGDLHIPFWDFDHTGELVERGYEIACRILDDEQEERLLKLIRE